MEGKIRILFFNKDAAGVNYFRTQTPAMQMERDHSDKFYVEINSNLAEQGDQQAQINYLKSFNIIHYHRALTADLPSMKILANELKNAGVTLVMDIDDYWHLDKTHPYYFTSIQKKLYRDIMENVKLADWVTTTTDLFASEIRKLRGDDNVIVLPNSIDPSWMKQFSPISDPMRSDLVTITYMAGSSHKYDVQQLRGMTNLLHSNNNVRDKFKMIVAGWDTNGTTTDVKFNKDFGTVLQQMGLWNNKMVKAINKSGGDVDLIPNLPDNLREQFRNNVFSSNQREIYGHESVYLDYEKILTDDYKIIKDEKYIKFLEKYERNTYPNEGNYARRWTQKANVYAEVLNETDVSLAPLSDHMFNRMKSNLKQVECWSRKIPIVCSDIPPYNVDGVNMKNCILIPNKKRNDRDWAKALKALITQPSLREDLGEQLHEDFKVKYHLKHVTNTRAEAMESIVYENAKVGA
jgi:glycosyltransferase involved in cell wall biosynthesis